MVSHDWLNHALVMIMTMREDDAANWNTDDVIGFAKTLSLDTLGFTVGGVTAFYPTDIRNHPRSPSLGDRDIVDEMVTALQKEGMRSIARIDASVASKTLLFEHPEWFTVNQQGQPRELHGNYVACPNGGYYREFMIGVIREILERYPFDGLWINAAQFSPWSTSQCFCPNCRRKFKERFGAELPTEDWNDMTWRHYNEWRYECMAEWMKLASETVREVRPECAWLPLSQVAESWDHIRRGGWETDYFEPHVDGIVLEAQRRYTNPWWPGLEAKYIRNLNPDKPGNVTCSYFYPWWRLYHMADAENRIWTAQILANGARPWLHITGFLSEHFDRRGLDSFRQMFSLFKKEPDVYEGTRSMAEVALVYSRQTLDNFGGNQCEENYLNGFRGFYNALMDSRIPFDVLSDKRLTVEKLQKYRAVALPNLACMTDETVKTIEAYVRDGGHIVATHKTGFQDILGVERKQSFLEPLLGIEYTGVTQEELKAAYGRIQDPDHAVFANIGDTDILPVGGDVCFMIDKAAERPALAFIPPVESEVGSGTSVPEFNKVDCVTDTSLVFSRKVGDGSVVYFPWQPDKVAFRYGLKDHFKLLCNALRMASGWEDQVRVDAPGLFDASLMQAKGRMVLHLVNFSAPNVAFSTHRRVLEEIMPVHDLSISVRLPVGKRCKSARAAVSGQSLDIEQSGDWVSLVLPSIAEFESILLEID